MDNAILLAERVVLGGVFAASGVRKVISSASLVDEIMDYQVAPREVARVLAPVLPPAELAIAISVLTGILLPVGSVGAGAFLVLFTAVMILNLRKGRRLSCHCFGKSGALIGPSTIMRNLVLLVLSCAIAIQSLPIRGLAEAGREWHEDLTLLGTPGVSPAIFGSAAMVALLLVLVGEMDVFLPYFRSVPVDME
ncbi:MAG: MauE/DoxX family redox-associated membrane protein [Chloroflexota bacterium]